MGNHFIALRDRASLLKSFCYIPLASYGFRCGSGIAEGRSLNYTGCFFVPSLMSGEALRGRGPGLHMNLGAPCGVRHGRAMSDAALACGVFPEFRTPPRQ